MEKNKEIKYYFPSNGTEGECFIATWCENCRKDTGLRGGKVFCSIFNKSLTCEQSVIIKQWIINDKGEPECTSFVDYREKRTVKKSRKQPNQTELF